MSDLHSHSDVQRHPRPWESILATLLMSAVIICVSVQVLSRYLIHFQASWTEEVARLLLLWVAALGSVLAISGRSHFRMDLIASRLRGRKGAIVFYVATALTAGFYLTFGYSGIRFCIEQADEVSATLHIPYAIPMAVIPLSALAMAYELYRRVSLKNETATDRAENT
jgi:TRAP-type C4-dicarboxylate transport system permease small subunit